MAEAQVAAIAAVTPTIQTESKPVTPQVENTSGEQNNLDESQSVDDTNLSKKEKIDLKRKYQLKVNGKEKNIELDLDNEEEVKKHLQKAYASDEKMREAAELRKAATEFIEALRNDPRKIMKELGVNEKELAQMIMNEELLEMEKSPEQKEIEKLQKQLSEIEDNKKKDDEKRKAEDFDRLQQDAEQKIETEISSALDLGGVAKTPYTVRKMAELMYVALENDIDLKPQDVVPLVRKQLEIDIKELFAASSDDVLEEMLKEQMPRIRKRNVAKAKQVAESAKQIKETSNIELNKKDDNKRITISEFLKTGKMR